MPINSFNSVFHCNAFWAMMLPISVSTMASDVPRGYWAQRLLWKISGFVMVCPLTIHGYDNIDNIEAYPFSEEKDLHVNVGRLIKFLILWKSIKNMLSERILDLSYSMAKEWFWSEKDVRFTAKKEKNNN